MNIAALDALARLRRLVRDEARRDLATALDVAAKAQAAVAAVRGRIAAEEAAVRDLEADDLAVEAFGRWLRRARVELQSADALRQRAEAEVARARAVLAAAGAALEAVEAALARARAEERTAGLRREQAALDEAAGRARPQESRQ